MAVTEHMGWPLPDEAAKVNEEFFRLRDQTLPQIDNDVHELDLAVAGKAAADHDHEIGDVTGLGGALAGKMPADATFTLEELQDVVGADAAPDGYVLVKVGGQWVAQAALAAIGDHDHTMGQVAGLEDALTEKAPLASPSLTGNPTAPTQTAGNNSTRIANTAFVQTAIDAIKGGVAAAFDTLVEIAAALGKRVAVDAAQGFSAAEQSQGRKNLGVGAPDIILEDRKASGDNGGTFTSGAYRTRDLNTKVRDVNSDCVLASNQFTLQAGAYYIEIDAPALLVDQHKVKLRNITDSSDVFLAPNAYATSATGAPGFSRSRKGDVVVIAGAKTFEVQHRCTTTRASNGFGIAASYGDLEVFTVVNIWRIQ